MSLFPFCETRALLLQSTESVDSLLAVSCSSRMRPGAISVAGQKDNVTCPLKFKGSFYTKSACIRLLHSLSLPQLVTLSPSVWKKTFALWGDIRIRQGMRVRGDRDQTGCGALSAGDDMGNLS